MSIYICYMSIINIYAICVNARLGVSTNECMCLFACILIRNSYVIALSYVCIYFFSGAVMCLDFDCIPWYSFFCLTFKHLLRCLPQKLLDGFGRCVLFTYVQSAVLMFFGVV